MKKARRDRPRKRLPPEEAGRPGAPPVPVVVGIGASAGGLEAVQQFLEAMPPETGLAFVHIQHLDPEHKSIMADLLQGSTRMRVVEATDGTRVEAGWVYVSPPDRDIALSDGVLRLTQAGEPRHGRLTIDGFFRTLAAAEGDRAVAVVLSGTGMDGTLGLRAVKNAGGMAIVQEPSSAKYDGMPRSAIAARLADFVARPEDIPRILLGRVKSPGGAPSEGEALASGAELRPIFDLLRERTGHDFSLYKPSTIRRRIVRRMAALKVARLGDYVQKLQGSGGEVDTLFRDLLIGVTTFFRDPEVFRTLEEKAIPLIADGSVGSGNIRVWVSACATGEEAYSLAILLAERLERSVSIARNSRPRSSPPTPTRRSSQRRGARRHLPGRDRKRDRPGEARSLLRPGGRRQYRIKPRGCARWSSSAEHNLLTGSALLAARPHAPCRNLLIYLRPRRGKSGR